MFELDFLTNGRYDWQQLDNCTGVTTGAHVAWNQFGGITKMKRIALLAALLACGLTTSAVVADDQHAGHDHAMPQMGAPAEMKTMAGMVGEWSFVMKWQMPGDTSWQETKGTATYDMGVDGCLLTMHVNSAPMMPGLPPFSGFGAQTYDRETKQWQMMWVDNMSARQTMYTGDMKDGKIVMTGEEIMMGQKSWARITVSNMTPTSYDWMYEMSMDGGKTWMTSMTSKYTKKA